MNPVERVARDFDGWQQRHAAVGFPIAVVKKFSDDQAGYLVSLLAYYAFVAAFPLLLALTAIGTSTWTVIVVIGAIFAPLIARTVRAAVLSERNLDYVAAARLRNEPSLYILFAEILPNVVPPVVVEASVRLGYAIFTVATLSFIGFGIQPPSPDWGLAVSESYGLLDGGIWWPVLFNTLAVASLVIGVNLAADGIQSVVDA